MAKITKKDLARGTKLTADHWNINKDKISVLLEGDIDEENLVDNNGKFSITYNWSRLIPEFFAYTNEVAITDARYEPESQGIYAPIILPPFQENWTARVGSREMPILRSFSVSFDNYMNNYAVGSEISSELQPTADSADLYTMNLEIREKEQWYNYGRTGLTVNRVSNIAPKTIYSSRIEGLYFNDVTARFNPYFVTGIDQIFHPFKTYLLKIDFPLLYNSIVDREKRYIPPSLTIKFDFEIGIVPKDTLENNEDLQNFPTYVSSLPNTFPLDTAVGGALISATEGIADNGRIQTNLEKVDELLLNGITSGMDLRSNRSVIERIIPDASYFCLAVPMFNQFLDIRASDLNYDSGLPYGPQGIFGKDPSLVPPFDNPWTGFLFDQRLIKISQPFTIHHVFAVHDYGSHFVDDTVGSPSYVNPERPRTGSGWAPNSPTFFRKIGVGIASGIRSESKKYEQVAYAEIVNDNKTSFLVDQIVDGVLPPLYASMNVNTNVNYRCDQEIFQVPLVPNIVGGQGSRSYYDQGAPYFVGRSDLNSDSRTQVGQIGGGTKNPETNGEELYLDVRWLMDDPTHLSYDTTDPTKPKGTQYVGTSGCWVYIIGKIPMTK